MMEAEKKNLEKLLLLIKELSSKPENEWFKNELTNNFGIKSTNESKEDLNFGNTDIGLIKKYLMLDVSPIIDYSDVDDIIVRNHLFRDCIEMSKYRLGKINNTISFDEFCRYAHLQAEQLLNYFYVRKFKNINDTILYIKQYNPKYNPTRLPANLNHIDYKIKLVAFKNCYNLASNVKSCLDFLSDLRNELSHRNSLQLADEDAVLSNWIKKGFNKYQDTRSMSDSDRTLFFSGKYIQTKRFQDFNQICDALNGLKKYILSNI